MLLSARAWSWRASWHNLLVYHLQPSTTRLAILFTFESEQCQSAFCKRVIFWESVDLSSCRSRIWVPQSESFLNAGPKDPRDNVRSLTSFSPAGCVWRWGWCEAGRSFCVQGGCGTRRCWSVSSWVASFRARAPASRVWSVGGRVFPERLCAERLSLVLLRGRRRRWDRRGPAPSHHHDAHPCDPAHLCTWRGGEGGDHNHQGDTHETLIWKLVSHRLTRTKLNVCPVVFVTTSLMYSKVGVQVQAKRVTPE